MTGALAEIVFCGLIILVAGTVLTRCADRIAEATGLGRVFVGGVFLAGATSLPELSVDLSAVRMGSPDLAAGDLLGSSLMNLLILAGFDSAGFSTRRAFGSDSRHHALSALLAVFMTAWVGLAAAGGGGPEALGAGLFSWVLLPLYLIGLRVTWLDQGLGEAARRLERPDRDLLREIARPVLGYAAAALVVFLTAPRLAHAADRVAQLSGLGRTFVGTTLLAVATSLPELVSTIAAFRLGSPDLAMGNIFGSNAFNMLLFLPLDLAMPGPFFAAVGPAHALTAFAVILAATLGVMGQVLKPRERRWFLEPSAEIIGLLIVGLLWLLYRGRG
ncbi:MAG: sodium:proton exchanger [Elusimicrobiota bacterium]|nr:sodium:proton exchanger [Elusimicrobiota bacterium]